MKDKDYSIETLRSLACFFVVVIHVSGTYFAQWGQISESNWLFINIFSTLSRFAVPMFTMIAGALVLNRDCSIKKAFKRVIKILIVLLVSSIFYLLVVDILLDGKAFNIKHWILAIIEHDVYYHLWYLYMLLGLYLLTPVLSRVVKNIDNKLWIYYIGLVLLFSFTKFIPNTSLILLGRKITPFLPFEGIGPYLGSFLIGYYLYHVVQVNKAGFKISILGFILTNGITFILTYVLTKISGVPTETIMDRNGITSILSAMFLLYMVRYIFNNNKIKLTFKKVVSFVGNLSLIVYIIHPLVLLLYTRFVKSYIVINFNISFIIELILVFIISLLISYTLYILKLVFMKKKL